MRVDALAAVAALAPSAAAQFINGGFGTGDLTGWSVALTVNGATGVQLVEPFDIDGPGPLGTSLAAKFGVGRASTGGAPTGGVELTQSITLATGAIYRVQFDWAAIRDSPFSNSQGGVFDLIVDGAVVATQAAGPVVATGPKFGRLSAAFSVGTAGSHTIGVRITRPFTVPGDTFQYVDNFILICRADLTTVAIVGQPGYGVPNGVLNNDDFFFFLAAFAAGNLAVADLTTTAVQGTPGYGVPNGVINNDDFFYYLAIFASGC